MENLNYKPIEGYEGKYIITDNGDVYSLPRRGTSGVIKKRRTVVTKNGYVQVQLCKDRTPKTFYIHILVANHFISKPSDYEFGGYVINHKDGNTLNNHVSNLEYITQSENVRLAILNKRSVK